MNDQSRPVMLERGVARVGLEQVWPLSREQMQQLVLVCGSTLAEWTEEAQAERSPALSVMINPALSGQERAFVLATPKGWLGLAEIYRSESLFEFMLQHYERYVAPMLCLYTRFAVGGAPLEQDAEARTTAAIEALGPAHTGHAEAMARLWWRQRRYAAVLAERDNKHPVHIDEAAELAAEFEADPPAHLLGEALEDIIALAPRFLAGFTGVRLSAVKQSASTHEGSDAAGEEA